MASTEVGPDMVQWRNGGWTLLSSQSQAGGGLFAVVSPQCGHCRNLKQSVDRAQEYRPFNFYYMIGDKSRESFQKVNDMNIEGFPTMYGVRRGGSLMEYNGPRDPHTLAATFSR